MKQLLSAVEVDDLGDDVQILACADAVWDTVAGEMKVVICAVRKLEVRPICRIRAVVPCMDKEVKPRLVVVVTSYIGDVSIKLDGASLVLRHELFDGDGVRLWVFKEGSELLVVLDRDVLVARRGRWRGLRLL